jgi:hypothetical protein
MCFLSDGICLGIAQDPWLHSISKDIVVSVSFGLSKWADIPPSWLGRGSSYSGRAPLSVCLFKLLLRMFSIRWVDSPSAEVSETAVITLVHSFIYFYGCTLILSMTRRDALQMTQVLWFSNVKAWLPWQLATWVFRSTRAAVWAKSQENAPATPFDLEESPPKILEVLEWILDANV